jgi:hypothetical protein
MHALLSLHFGSSDMDLALEDLSSSLVLMKDTLLLMVLK